MEPKIMTAISWGMVTTGSIGLVAAGTPLVRAVSRSLFGRAGGIFQYREASAFLTKPEQQAFDYLQKALSGRGHVCPKVRVADLVHVDPTSLRETGDRMRALGHIAQKHVDFVVMGPGYKPVFAVEVDDASHAREDRRARDVFVNEVFAQAGLSLIRVKPFKLGRSRALAAAIDTLKGGQP